MDDPLQIIEWIRSDNNKINFHAADPAYVRTITLNISGYPLEPSVFYPAIGR
jgi:hypothetical protein